MATIAVDLDNTLVQGDKAIPYAKEAINLLREQGNYIVIHTCNSLEWAEKVLNNNDIRFDHIWGTIPGRESKNKPLCDLYVDDKGYHFKGDWKEAVSEITDRVTGLDNRKVKLL